MTNWWIGSNSTAVIDLSESSDGKLFTRTFKVDAGQFARRFGFSTPEPVAQGGSGRSQTRTNEFQTGFINLRNHFLTNGINLDGSAGKAIYYKDQQGWLYVRATLKELDAIEPVLAQLQREATIINIKARFIEVPSAQMPRVMNLLLTNAGSMGPQLFVQQHLADPEAKKILNELDAMPGVQLLSAPEVTTLNGRQAQIQIVDIKTIVTGLTPVLTNGGTNMMPATQAIPFGPTLDIVPTLSADDLTIEMRVIPTVTEFLGYDDPRKLPGYDVRAGAENVPLPRIRVRQMAESIAVGEGQTVVLGGFKDQTITTIPSGSKTNATQGVDKHLLVFITPTIVDSNGNRVYPGGDIKNDKAGQP